jgi:hypothetical protein
MYHSQHIVQHYPIFHFRALLISLMHSAPIVGVRAFGQLTWTRLDGKHSNRRELGHMDYNDPSSLECTCLAIYNTFSAASIALLVREALIPLAVSFSLLTNNSRYSDQFFLSRRILIDCHTTETSSLSLFSSNLTATRAL